MRPKLKEVSLPLDTVKEFADLIPKPEDYYHYRIHGDWQENREVYRVQEGDNVISDYTFPEKSDISRVQFASRKTYTKAMNMWGKLEEKPVQFDRKTGTWKKLNVFQRIKQHFSKETNIPSQVVSEIVEGKDVSVLHTMEQKRPVGTAVQEAELRTLQDAKVDLGLKYKHLDHSLILLKDANRDLEIQNASLKASIRSLNARLIAANISTIGQNMTSSSEPPTYGNITPAESTQSKQTSKKSSPPERTPPKKNEKLDKRGDEVIRQFEENVKKAEDAKLDAE